MGRKPAPQPLPLSEATAPAEPDQPSGGSLRLTSPADSTRSPRSPRSPFRLTQKRAQSAGGKQPLHVADLVQQQPEEDYPPISATLQEPFDQPTYHPSGQQPPLHQQQHQSQPQHQHQHDDRGQGRGTPSGHRNHNQRHNDEKASKSGFFFSFGKSSKSAERLQPQPHSDSRNEIMSRGTDRPGVNRQNSKQSAEYSVPEQPLQKPMPTYPSKSEVSLASSAEFEPSSNAGNRKDKSKGFRFGRTGSIRDADTAGSLDTAPAKLIEPPERAQTVAALKTAPVAQHDRSFREMMSSSARNHSADRAHARDTPGRDGHRDRDHVRGQPSSLRENGGSAFFSGLKSSSSKAADMISKGLFGKNSRSGSTTEREPVVDDEHYVLKVINLPLVEQTRRTRISKRLEDSRDKTEFWMPAFPWRAIDYLNYKGTDVEGLYRVPGSGPQIKKWQRKFDEEYDVDLFEQDDLYDINIIGSMLKAWLRELPDELFPKAAQERVARECAGAEKVPQLLIDELSNLSPFNYYLLFAITCHLSLLLAHSDKNKMDFRNLCICFQPCMKIDAFSFKFLVCDWRECWKGCKNEAKFIEEEYMLFDQPPPQGIAAPRAHEEEEGVPEDRNVSSSGSSKQSNQSGGEAGKARLKKKTHAPENASVASASTISTNLTIDSRQETTTPRRSNDLRPLSPIKPLSPLGF